MTEAAGQNAAPRRAIKSFVRREGRLTDGQKRALEQGWPYYGLEPVASLLDLSQLFGRTAPVVLEIGFGNGDHLLARATAEPQHDFIGAEVHRPGIGRLLSRAQAAGLRNLRVTAQDAVEFLRGQLADGALSEVVIQFPDPWHKKRHHKRRLIQPDFAQLLAQKICMGGHLQLATDWADYASQMLAVLNAEPAFRNDSADCTYVPKPATRLKTKFEARGERLGHTVFDLQYTRR